MTGFQPPLDQLAAFLTARRQALLGNWRMACETDADMHSAATLSHHEFNDLTPVLLTALEERLAGKPCDIVRCR